ncbi:serine/threonine-protein phosphatase 6 regulatory ankyrin repeat subunit C-like [Nasonia vitripennis]|uniref:Ankyrin repeat protein n=1 Tax=Nasonia vitripennis TaxID=7425 RepID=A0A7M7HFM0_NASVI|nr:serine/threonine-protein phosphatase 6 regulatory ankyrin repeat subunit C-like [Nasonia vitripennis]XP_008213418.1 serine/threonine-protein phosphatase 6 regulatory ankyrin repeat subunit C-like [Nasonia vitripennis]XP_008213419.1 serine/threonine-protein phosphatase 6 regulatory ankyrin repeat subunit C-like [Nasonia vitripennis]XP_032453721.1 serine/threonine-protein phosphatase 6 regulatory ankyrin repeat subunit C-like [Nasonia vitripennis]
MTDDFYDDLVTAKILLDAGANVNIKDNSNFNDTPLHKAAYRLESKTVDLLLSYEADVNLQNCYGDTALHKVARTGQMTYGDEDDKHSKQLCILQSLLKKGADVNIENQKEQTPFHYLLETGNKEAIELLITHGANLTKEDYKDRGPLLFAAVNSDASVMKLLIDKGCNIEERDIFDRTPLHRAIK